MISERYTPPTSTTAYQTLVSETAQILGISGASHHAGSYWQLLWRTVKA